MENMVVKSKFWQGKKVLITGHTGFKGGWLSLWLQEMGSKVIGLALDPPTNPNLFDQANVAENMLSLKADIRELDPLKKIFQDQKPEIVFHLAAQSLVRYSYLEPVETYQTNVIGSLNILEAIKYVNSVRSVVMVTTDKCYDNQEWVWGYRENEPMGGHDPYSSSKGCAELLIASFRDSFFPNHAFEKHKTGIASVRAGNVIGGGDWAEDRLIPDIFRAIKNRTTVRVRNPNAIRPWQHVLEPLSGYLMLAEKLYKNGDKYAEAWNFGPKEEDTKTVEWIINRISKQLGEETRWTYDDGDHPHEANYLKLDCSKAHNILLWKPKWSLDQALIKIIEWYRDELTGKNVKEKTLSQINEYMKLEI